MSVDTEDEARKACVEMFFSAQEAVAEGKYFSTCIHGEPVFYYEYSRGLIPGHIYSKSGIDEYRISACCEYHFDDMFKETDETP